jgi:hypothetical protein
MNLLLDSFCALVYDASDKQCAKGISLDVITKMVALIRDRFLRYVNSP